MTQRTIVISVVLGGIALGLIGFLITASLATKTDVIVNGTPTSQTPGGGEVPSDGVPNVVAPKSNTPGTTAPSAGTPRANTPGTKAPSPIIPTVKPN